MPVPSNPRLMSMRDFQDSVLENQSGSRRRPGIQTESSQAGGGSPVSILSVLRHWVRVGCMVLRPLTRCGRAAQGGVTRDTVSGLKAWRGVLDRKMSLEEPGSVVL